MAITKLRHIKESKGSMHSGLKKAIVYILNPEKTEQCLYSGGNAGRSAQEIFQTFIDTKKYHRKCDGRQAYHFVLSFRPGEVDAERAYRVVGAFCEEYLSDAYDYVYAIHLDKEHLHGHILFNSVNRQTGLKYHYKNGDWKKTIQTVTDRVCVDEGLEPLMPSQEKKGVAYAEWRAKKEGGLTNDDLIRADIDYAISRTKSFSEFVRELEKLGYQIRLGNSQNHGAYLALRMPGAKKARRTYKLGKGYSVQEIADAFKRGSKKSYKRIEVYMQKKTAPYMYVILQKKQHPVFKRLHQAVSFYKLPNPYAVPAARVREDMKKIEKLIEQCRYIHEHGIESEKEVQEHLDTLCSRKKEMEKLRKNGADSTLSEELKACRRDIRLMKSLLNEQRERKEIKIDNHIQR